MDSRPPPQGRPTEAGEAQGGPAEAGAGAVQQEH